MAVVNGTKGDDTIFVDGGNDVVKAGNGNDWIYAGAGNDVITGGKGSNIIDFNTIKLPFEQEAKPMGHDVVNLTSGEQVLLDCSSKADVRSIDMVGKDVVITFNDEESITLKNFASKDVVGSKGKVELSLANDRLIDVKSYLFEAGAFSKKGAYTGKWLSEVIDASDIETAYDKKSIKGVSVKAGAGEDEITGSKFNDTLYGGNDNDLVKGGEGADKLYGDKGNDSLYGGVGKDSLYGGDGDDEIVSGEWANPDDEYDYTVIDVNDNLLDGGKGNDWLNAGSGNDTLKGADGDDTLFAGEGNNLIDGGKGDDWLLAGAGTSTLKGGAGVDLLESDNNGTNNLLYAGAGDDSIEARGTGDIAYGEDGNDQIDLFNNTKKTAFGGKGNDYISIEKGQATVYGEAGNDTIRGGKESASDIVIAKNGGNDVYINRGADGDTLVFDKITASALTFKEVTHIRPNRTWVWNSEINDYVLKIEDVERHELIIEYGKNQSVVVEDYYKDGSKASTSDIYVQTKDGGKVLLSDLLAAELGSSKSDIIVTDKDLVYAYEGNDNVTATAKDAVVYGGTGNDKLYCSENSVALYGEAGNDFLEGGTGDDSLYGGVGKDTIYGGDGDDEIYGSYFENDEIEGFVADNSANYLDGGRGNDWIYGSSKNDTIYGGDGNDAVWTFGGSDKVYGGEGNDSLVSEHSGSKNKLYGENGNDYIEIKMANDTAFGGAGDDLINLEIIGKQVAYGGDGNDTLSIVKGDATVYGEAGDDSINGGREKASNIVFASGDGNDIYLNRGADDVLVFDKIASSDLSYTKSDNNLIIKYVEGSSVTVKDYFNYSDVNLYIKTKNGKELLSEALDSYITDLKTNTPEGAIAGTIGNDEFSAVKESAVVYGYNGDDTFTVSNDWAARGEEAGKTTTVTFDGGAGNDTFKFGYGTYDVNVSGGAGADVFDFTGSWPHDVWIEEEKQIATGANITISDISADDKVIFSQYTANHMAGEGVYVNNSADGYAKYSMFFDVTVDENGKGSADLSNIMFSLKDESTVASKWNDELGLLNTSFVLQTEDGTGSVLDAKFFVRDESDNDVEYKFNEAVINQITEKVASWLSTETEYGSVMEAIADGNKDVLAQFVNAVKPYDQGFGTESYVGEDILVPVV